MNAAAASAQTTADKQTTDTPDHKANDDETKQTEALTPSLYHCFEFNMKSLTHSYICASIGEVGDGASIGEVGDGRFDILVDLSAALPSTQSNIPADLPEMKPSLIRCNVTWRGYVHDITSSTTAKEALPRIPVAKVILSPWTGRRYISFVYISVG